MPVRLSDNYERELEVPLPFAVVREAVRRNHHRTPLLLIDPEVIRSKIRRFRAAMPGVALHYAVKANPHPDVLRTMIAEAVGFEVASVAELETLLALSVPAHEVHFNNPIKPPEHVAAAARAGVRWYVIDSIEELRKVAGIKRDAHLCLRIETQNIGSDWPLTGKFGATMLEVEKILQAACELKADVAGVAFHVGSQCSGVYHGMMEALGGLEYDIRTDRHDAEIPCTVAGPTCDSIDVVARDKLLPEDLQVGDYVYIPNAGAYTTAYATRFNGFPPPYTLVTEHARASQVPVCLKAV
jgi:diaminopimelate decarboxylase